MGGEEVLVRVSADTGRVVRIRWRTGAVGCGLGIETAKASYFDTLQTHDRTYDCTSSCGNMRKHCTRFRVFTLSGRFQNLPDVDDSMLCSTSLPPPPSAIYFFSLIDWMPI